MTIFSMGPGDPHDTPIHLHPMLGFEADVISPFHPKCYGNYLFNFAMAEFLGVGFLKEAAAFITACRHLRYGPQSVPCVISELWQTGGLCLSVILHAPGPMIRNDQQ